VTGDGIVHVERNGADRPDEGRPVFYYDLASPESYIVAEHIGHVLGVMPEWQPVLAAGLPAGELGVFRCAEERTIHMSELERRAGELGMQPLRFPPDWPTDSAQAMRVATYAKQIGRAVAFSLAAFRQAFAAGRDLSDPDSVVIAAAACEMHPNAVLKAAGMRSIAEALEQATSTAAAGGVDSVPAVRAGDEVFHGEASLEEAARAVGGAAPR
jgi:2-hydroxychromene-2-carboxylate isomerase